MPPRAKKIPAIEAEFDESFEECVKGFARMGYSHKATAEAMEISVSYFFGLCDRMELDKYYGPQRTYNETCRPGGTKGQGYKYTESHLLSLVAQYPKVKQFIKKAPVSHMTIYRRFNLPWREIVAIAKEQRH